MRQGIIKGKLYRYIGTLCSKPDAVRYFMDYQAKGYTCKLVLVHSGEGDYKFPAYSLFIS